MNLDRYEKIDGREALKRLLDGERVLDALADEHFLDGTKLARVRKSGAFEIANDGLRGILERSWYIPKPFDVRQAMRDRPNEWVGAYKNKDGDWCKVGFDTRNYMAVEVFMEHIGAPSFDSVGADYTLFAELDDCIPIEDVPKEATR